MSSEVLLAAILVEVQAQTNLLSILAQAVAKENETAKEFKRTILKLDGNRQRTTEALKKEGWVK